VRSGRFFPYATFPDRLSLVVRKVAGESAEFDDRANLHEFGVGVFSVELDLTVGDDLTHLVEAGSGTAPTQLVLIGDGIAARTRSVLGKYPLVSQTVEPVFDTRTLRGTLDVHAAVTIGDPSGFPRLVAWSETIRVNIDRPDIGGIGSSLPVRWEKFGASDELSDQVANLYTIGWDAEAAMPEIILNSDYPSAYEVLTNKGTHGPRARIRDATFASIAGQAWGSLLSSALSTAAALIADDVAPADVPEELDSWERVVLESWAPLLAPGRPAEDALTVVLEQLDGDNPGEYGRRIIPRAVQTRLELGKAFTGQVLEFIESKGA
jgi:hypothetical protein